MHKIAHIHCLVALLAFICDEHLHEVLMTSAIACVHIHCTCALVSLTHLGKWRHQEQSLARQWEQPRGRQANAGALEMPEQREERLAWQWEQALC